MRRFIPLKEGQRCSPRTWNSEHAAGFVTACVIVLGALLYLRGTAVNGTNPLFISSLGPRLPASAGQLPSSPQLPKVALMFMSRGPMPLGPVWRVFLAAAAATVNGSTGPWEAMPKQVPPSWQMLFSVYIHPPPDFAFPSGSIFSGHEVPDRVAVKWGAVTEALGTRALLRAALADPLNQRFVLLSESCIPLYPPATVYWQLMSEQRSRVTACPTEWSMPIRYQAGMADFGIFVEDWRKASQWVSLLRKHAQLAVADDVVLAAFARECRGDRDVPEFCLASEHYLPVLLAKRGLEGECNCDVGLTFDEWTGDSHPRSFTADEATPDMIARFRGGEGCVSQSTWGEAAKAAIRTALQMAGRRQVQVPGPSEAGPTNYGSSSSGSSDGGEAGAGAGAAYSAVQGLQGSHSGDVAAAAQIEAGVRDLVRAGALLNITAMSASCPLFARKIAREGAGEWIRLLQPILTA